MAREPKSAAEGLRWRYARGLWTDRGLGIRDKTNGSATKEQKPRGPYGKRGANFSYPLK